MKVTDNAEVRSVLGSHPHSAVVGLHDFEQIAEMILTKHLEQRRSQCK